MIKEIKYIIKDVAQTIWFDLKKGHSIFEKPRELMKIMLWFFIIMLATENYRLAKLTMILYAVTYFWLIIQRARWKHWIREDYKKIKG